MKKGELLHPEREPQSVLDDLRVEQGSLTFAAQWLQDPTPDSGNMVKKDHIHLFPRGLSLALGHIYQSWDTALKGDPSSDYSVCTTWFQRGAEHFLLDVYRKQVTFLELLAAAKDLYHEHRPEAVLIEETGSGMSLIQQLKAETSITAIGIKPKLDKIARLASVLPMLEGKQVLLMDEAPWLPVLLQELHGFPQAKYDDQVDSMTQYLTWARDRSYSTFSCDWGNGPSGLSEAPPEPGWHPEYIPFR